MNVKTGSFVTCINFHLADGLLKRELRNLRRAHVAGTTAIIQVQSQDSKLKWCSSWMRNGPKYREGICWHTNENHKKVRTVLKWHYNSVLLLPVQRQAGSSVDDRSSSTFLSFLEVSKRLLIPLSSWDFYKVFMGISTKICYTFSSVFSLHFRFHFNENLLQIFGDVSVSTMYFISTHVVWDLHYPFL